MNGRPRRRTFDRGTVGETKAPASTEEVRCTGPAVSARYSSRRLAAGSVRRAARAGPHAATAATTARSVAAPAYETGSAGPTP